MLTLPNKRIEFNFDSNQELFQELWNVCNAKDDLVKLEQSATKIIEIAAKLKDEANRENEKKYLDKIENAREFDERLAKRLTVMMEENSVGVYIGKRERFLSAIHTFFSQLLLLKSGANLSELANQEVFANLEDFNINNLEEKKLINGVALAEKLIYSFKFFVNEPLAIRNFVFNI